MCYCSLTLVSVPICLHLFFKKYVFSSHNILWSNNNRIYIFWINSFSSSILQYPSRAFCIDIPSSVSCNLGHSVKLFFFQDQLFSDPIIVLIKKQSSLPVLLLTLSKIHPWSCNENSFAWLEPEELVPYWHKYLSTVVWSVFGFCCINP